MHSRSRGLVEHAVTKVPAVTPGFWIIKVACTTLGETGGDWVTMSLNMGYLIGSLIFLAAFVVLVSAQIRAHRFNSFLYWATIIATTTLADFCDRSFGVGYPGGVAIVFALLAASLAIWYRVEGTVSIESVVSARVEWFYWITLLFSQTLGATLGDFFDKPIAQGGLAFSRLYASGILVAFIAACLLLIPQRAAHRAPTA
jgi:uncharacterized membrane-anchored protein